MYKSPYDIATGCVSTLLDIMASSTSRIKVFTKEEEELKDELIEAGLYEKNMTIQDMRDTMKAVKASIQTHSGFRAQTLPVQTAKFELDSQKNKTQEAEKAIPLFDIPKKKTQEPEKVIPLSYTIADINVASSSNTSSPPTQSSETQSPNDETTPESYMIKDEFLFVVSKDDKASKSHSNIEQERINIQTSKLINDFESLLDNDRLSDVTFKFGPNKEVKAHMLILAARSPIFASMFEQDIMDKKTSKAIYALDVDIDIFKQLLKFIYTGKLPEIDKKTLPELLKTANKYGIYDLKNICEDDIEKNISIDNAADILVLADLTNSERLKTKAIDYILANKSRVIESTSYKEMLKSHIHLIEEMFRKM